MTATQGPDIEARIVEVLAAHRPRHLAPDAFLTPVTCTCGPGWNRDLHRTWEEHVAAVLAAGFVRPEDVAEAQAKVERVERLLHLAEQRAHPASPTSPALWCWELAAALRPVDERDPKPCARCGETCRYDGWGHVHADGIGIGSCALRPVDAPEGGAE